VYAPVPDVHELTPIHLLAAQVFTVFSAGGGRETVRDG
jgi:hypothetical protein